MREGCWKKEAIAGGRKTHPATPLVESAKLTFKTGVKPIPLSNNSFIMRFTKDTTITLVPDYFLKGAHALKTGGSPASGEVPHALSINT